MQLIAEFQHSLINDTFAGKEKTKSHFIYSPVSMHVKHFLISVSLSTVVTVGLQMSNLELPEENPSTGEGTVFEVCVEVRSPGQLARPVNVYLSLEGGSAQGELY